MEEPRTKAGWRLVSDLMASDRRITPWDVAARVVAIEAEARATCEEENEDLARRIVRQAAASPELQLAFADVRADPVIDPVTLWRVLVDHLGVSLWFNFDLTEVDLQEVAAIIAKEYSAKVRA